MVGLRTISISVFPVLSIASCLLQERHPKAVLNDKFLDSLSLSPIITHVVVANERTDIHDFISALIPDYERPNGTSLSDPGSKTICGTPQQLHLNSDWVVENAFHICNAVTGIAGGGFAVFGVWLNGRCHESSTGQPVPCNYLAAFTTTAGASVTIGYLNNYCQPLLKRTEERCPTGGESDLVDGDPKNPPLVTVLEISQKSFNCKDAFPDPTRSCKKI